MKLIYVVYRKPNGTIESKTVEVEGKVNHLSVEKAVRDSIYDIYDRTFTILSWQEEDEFTWEEQEEFWKNH